MNESTKVCAEGIAEAPYDGPVSRDTFGPGAVAEALAVPGFDSIARIVTHALQVPLAALVLADGSTFCFTPSAPDAPAVSQVLQRFLQAAVARSTPHVELDTGPGDAPASHAATLPVRFFASMPVFTLTAQHVGALCVIDHAPRQALAESELEALEDAAMLAGAGVVLRSYLGRTDPVTHLPHRSSFSEDLHARVANGAKSIALVAIEVAPVARFNAFIRAMGHAYADVLVRLVAERVQDWMRDDMRLYQVGITRFAVLLAGPDALHAASELDRLVSSLRQPFDCEGIPLSVQPGVGLLEMPAADLKSGDALRLVMSASHAAQQSVRGWARYEREQDDLHRQEFFLVTELSAALNDPHSSTAAELELHYQPRVDLRSGRCVAVEALARWHHPTLGDVSPGRFVPLAEQAGLMRALTDWVLVEGLGQLAQWRRDGLGIQLSVNVSSTDFEADLVARLQQFAQRYALPLDQVELEFTENTFMQHSAATGQRLAELRELGVGIAIDDFGTGYSNLAYMRKLPASTLKIDQSFVSGLGDSPDDATIVRSIASMAHKLGFRVVVEGVETEQVYRAVKDMECDEMQGYFVARPMPAAELVPWLAEYAAHGLQGAG